MTVLATFEVEGDPAELLQLYDDTLPEATAGAHSRPIAHYCTVTTSGIMIVDVWASRDDIREAITENAHFQDVWARAGWPDETVHVYEVHNTGWPGP
jgi:hypothetical protein